MNELEQIKNTMKEIEKQIEEKGSVEFALDPEENKSWGVSPFKLKVAIDCLSVSGYEAVITVRKAKDA